MVQVSNSPPPDKGNSKRQLSLENSGKLSQMSWLRSFLMMMANFRIGI